MSLRNKTTLLAAAVCFLIAYREVISDLVHDWLTDPNYTHGLLVAPIAAVIVWQRRGRLAELAARPSTWGLIFCVLSLAALAGGTLGAEMFTARVSMLGLIAGAIWFVWGRDHLRMVAFPLVLMLLTIPLPAIVFNQIALPLQSLAARAGEAGLATFHVPALREGNVIVLATGSLEVAEACSGIRSLMSLVALSALYGYFTDAGPKTRVALALSAVPIAVMANGVRVAGTGIAAAQYGSEVAEGFFHMFSGWLMFILAFALLVSVHRMFAWVLPSEAVCQDA